MTIMPRPSHTPTRASAESGFSLIVGLIFLVVMSLLGITMMNVTRMETMMAGSAREANIAFQAAETALRRGEAAIEAAANDPAGLAAFDGSAGMLGLNDAEPDFQQTDSTAADYAWDNTWSIEYSTGCPAAASCYPEVLAQPRFAIKRMDEIVDSSAARQAIGIGSYGGSSPAPITSVFSVTARAISRDGSAETIIRSYYGRIF
jgi:type IV pilus assembly protein PilX